MRDTAAKLLSAVMQLEGSDRAELARRLICSLDDDADVAWDAELEARLPRIESGEDPGRPAEEVLGEIRAKFAK
jgi:putative addiction module component (TIGR02574 family)